MDDYINILSQERTFIRSHRGQGIGKTLMEFVLKEAEKNIPQLRIVTLQVFGNNPLAQAMYKKIK